MSELRIKLLDLAIQAGATIENATKVASDWECWATDSDPLMTGTTGPKIDGQKKWRTTGLNFLEAISKTDYHSPFAASRDGETVYYFDEDGQLVMDVIEGAPPTMPILNMQDLLLSDWKIIEP